jgi:hypothetical protein
MEGRLEGTDKEAGAERRGEGEGEESQEKGVEESVIRVAGEKSISLSP